MSFKFKNPVKVKIIPPTAAAIINKLITISSNIRVPSFSNWTFWVKKLFFFSDYSLILGLEVFPIPMINIITILIKT